MKISPIKEIEFVYKGYKCVVLFMPWGFRTGYIKLPKNSRYYGILYDKIPIDCHGGLTYSEQFLFSQKNVKDVWWIGFDCGHWSDEKDIEAYIKYYGKDAYSQILSIIPGHGEIKTLYFCIQECTSIVNQIIELEENK